ncbi:unnamed protein product [Fusarium graminearum]|uniref:Uncharacterized protein n=1 Tax=Gibberella zeae TaxID=5518 RepID=A0A4E9DD59_GIBZA|nr:unnamed protein product [Fusarium graminearum]CAG1972666.1 unnamed protein product [Fusarium graminearum]
MEWRGEGFTVGKAARLRETDDEGWLAEMAQARGRGMRVESQAKVMDKSKAKRAGEWELWLALEVESSFAKTMMMVILSFKDDRECGVGGTGGLR